MTSARRRGYLDAARGLAVLLMIEAHTTDAWTRAASKTTAAFRNATILGGFAAPLFLFLAGVACAFAASRAFEKTGMRSAAADAVSRRGLEIFILAFLFRLQAFIVSPGASPLTLFRVDILNVMGPAIVLSGLAWGLARSTSARVWTFALAAAATALVTPIVRAHPAVDLLPVWVQWYVRPAGEQTTFTLLPWAGFVFAGAAVGVPLASCRDAIAERRAQLWIVCVGAAVVALSAYAAARPTIYAVPSSFWTSSPAWFAMRTGIVMVAVAAAYAIASISHEDTKTRRRTIVPLERIGRRSLFVYWIHVELVYGYASWYWHGVLPLWGTALAYAAFSAAMYAAVCARDRIAESRRRPPAPAYTSPVGAAGPVRL